MSFEPRLTEMDRRIFDDWRMQAMLHARSSLHKRRVERSMGLVEAFRKSHPSAYLSWSAGKDSTAMVHLAVVECGLPIAAMSIKDDLDFPGEEPYLMALSSEWGIALDIVRPPFSLQDRLSETTINASGEFHSRASRFADEAFYRQIEEYSAAHGRPGVFLGLRSSESKGRAVNRASRGTSYQKRNGEWVCQPICDWSGLDVFAYLFAREIPILDVYRCVRLHDSPERVRKSWWLPGSSTRHGQAVWLRTYYPSLFRRLCELLPSASTTA